MLSVWRSSALRPAAPFRRRNPQLLQLRTQPVNPKQPNPVSRTESPHPHPPERKPSGDSVSPHRGHVGHTEPGSAKPPPLPLSSPPSPPPRPSFAFPRPQCEEQSSANGTPLRQKGTAVCLQPLIQIQIADPASLPQGRPGANCARRESILGSDLQPFATSEPSSPPNSGKTSF